MNIRHLFILAFLLIVQPQINAQIDSLLSKIAFETDFRFRIEQDWDSQKSDGSFRDDRTRLRYRLRTGATYRDKWYSLGFRIRTGDQKKQQDPQLTLGKGLQEFGTLPIGFEKIFFQANRENFKIWFGKNSFSFEKNNELFWSDNVFPEGIFIEHSVKPNFQKIEKISLKGSHYVLISNGKSILKDAYLQGLQTSIHFENQRIVLFPSMYIFRNIPNIPDGGHSYVFNYSIFHFGAKLKILRSDYLLIDFDFYQNFEDYDNHISISDEFTKEKTGYSFGIQYGKLKDVNDWKFKITYTAMQKYAALDYMAQNDWARWDYSGFDSPDGRLTNFKGIEVVIGYNISKKINLIAKYYNVTQLVSSGSFEETGQRIRFDINVTM